MIVAEPKPIKEVAGYIKDCTKILVVGCGGCTSVCMAGGETEAEMLAASLRILRKMEGRELVTAVTTITRQCEPEFVESISSKVKEVDAVVSLGCGVGVQFLAEHYRDKWVLPALNTVFAGGTVQAGIWEERCGLCGDCILHLTGGICPVIRCAKSILNGPCGGSQNGKCEINPDTPCAWHLIYEKLSAMNRLDLILQFHPAKDWSKERSGGLRNRKREDAVL
ncbi:MAG: methylenetetrahydrofolate reductase C-terminal domain-containing protein [Desulfotomaculum sp.]|nr:methylenetetrahydrofolate reductase C-terminal domain-containing protein [Desulfotomaculum sp.]